MSAAPSGGHGAETRPPARLRWRCRRGTRELDALLDRWLVDRYAEAGPARRADFERLLDAQDPDLWDWLMGRAAPPDAGLAAIVEEIRRR